MEHDRRLVDSLSDIQANSRALAGELERNLAFRGEVAQTQLFGLYFSFMAIEAVGLSNQKGTARVIAPARRTSKPNPSRGIQERETTASTMVRMDGVATATTKPR